MAIGFSAQVNLWVAKALRLEEVAVKSVWKELYAGILARSPVKTERFRDSNRIGINSKDESVESPRHGRVGNAPFPGGPKLSEGESIIDSASLEDTIFISNSLPYARLLEDGYSKAQAPGTEAIYGATVADVRARIGQIISKSIKGL
jgi:hypothetical protein